MNYVEFMNELINKKTSGVYLIDSNENYLRDNILTEVKNEVKFPDFNYSDIKGAKDIEIIKTSLETYPVMEDMKYVIWREIDLSRNSVKEYEDILSVLNEMLKDFPGFVTFLVFSNNSPYKSNKFYKEVQKYGNIVTIDRLNRAELESFIGKRFVRSKKRITKSLVSDIVDRFSYLKRDSEIELYDIVNSVDKIIANTSSDIISPEDVSSQLDEILNLNIFNLTDAISEKNSKRAIETYLSMARTVDDQMMIYHMIIRQVRNLIGVKLLLSKSHNDNSIMQKLGIKNFELKKLKGFVRNFSTKELFDIHDRLFDMEVRQKSQDFDLNLELMLLINKMCK